MDTISEPYPGLSEEPEDTSLDRRETSQRRFALKSCNIVFLMFGLLSILLIALPFNSATPLTEGREHIMDELGMPTEDEEAPSIIDVHSSTQRLPVGQTARFTCNASGTPEPTVEWLHNGRPLERNGTDDQSEAWVESSVLFIRGVKYGVNTVFCMASNSAGTANHTAELVVFDACELTLDPNTAYRRLSLSKDNRQVTRVEEDQLYPDHPERFDLYPQVLCREALTGHCYWEVERKGGVYIGVTYRGITRGGGYDSMLGGNNKSCSLVCHDGGYIACYNGIETAIHLPPAGSTRVGVYLDRPAGTLSFYRVSLGVGGSSDTLTHIHTFTSTFTQEDLLPGFGLGEWEASVSLCRL